MGAQLRVFRRRIRSVNATKKITRAMELIASSRIIKAQNQVAAATPYATALYKAVSLAASNARGNHPLLLNKKDGKRAAVLLITADRGLAGAYSANILKEGERLTELLRDEQGKEVIPFIVGRKGLGYYKFRNRAVAASWTGITDRPTYDDARVIAKALLEIFLKEEAQGGVDEIQIIYTRFVNRISQVPVVQRIVPLEVVEELVQASAKMTEVDTHKPTLPLYDFEPSPDAVLNELLPKYIEYLVYAGLLQAAASEHAARQRAMKSATENAEDLIKSLTRRANQARQAEITQEISEIVGGADSLKSAN
ncbi:MAG: F0F1 ATP synthase subunit gamma [Actinobacteria bacterium]|nr:F0F1 ATP synthase subunit gamma [Actinomycetota bacterium]